MIRIPHDIQQSCELVRVIEKSGSYEIVAALTEPRQLSFLDFQDVGAAALNKYLQIIEAISSPSNSERVDQLITDARYLRRILKSIESYCPRFGQGWSLYICGADDKPHGCITRETRRAISQVLETSVFEHGSVIGKMVRVHFDENRVGIYYAPTHRVLDCFYQPEIEDFIVENLKELVQVSGVMQLDANGYPDKIVDVDKIEGIDLDPVTIETLESDGVSIIFKDPIIIEPKMEEGLILFEWPELNISSSSSHSVEKALEEFETDIAWVYKEYYMEGDELLVSDARQLEQYLSQITKGVANEQPKSGRA